MKAITFSTLDSLILIFWICLASVPYVTYYRGTRISDSSCSMRNIILSPFQPLTSKTQAMSNQVGSAKSVKQVEPALYSSSLSGNSNKASLFLGYGICWPHLLVRGGVPPNRALSLDLCCNVLETMQLWNDCFGEVSKSSLLPRVLDLPLNFRGETAT